MWLLEPNVRQLIEQATATGVLPSVEQQAHFEAQHFSNAGETSRILTVAGDNAEISISGVITQTPSFLAMLFGGGNTTYSEIVSALATADADESISNITLAIDSPGGQFEGMFEALAAIKATSKPTTAVISNVGASAAFAIASQADTIVASNRAARIGSVGVVATFQLNENEIQIASSDAPKKRPDVTTEKGQAMVREELDAMHEIFVGAIAEGRGTTASKVNAEFGQGATVLAGEALKRGMIDSIAGEKPNNVVKITRKTETAVGGETNEANNMDLATLQAQHSDVYTAVLKLGATTERDRVTAHLTMGEASGDMKTAIAAINEGSEMTATLQANYMAAGMNRKNVADRQDDDAGANAGDNATADDDKGDTDVVASMVEASLGITEVK